MNNNNQKGKSGVKLVTLYNNKRWEISTVQGKYITHHEISDKVHRKCSIKWNFTKINPFIKISSVYFNIKHVLVITVNHFKKLNAS